MRTSEICPDARFGYPEGAYTMLYVYEDGVPIQAWDIIPHNFLSAMKVLDITDYVAETILPEHMTSEEY